jgi:hypothetical protein
MTQFSDDPGSLDRLHDLVAPPPVPWWPPAPAWYALGVVVFVLLAVLAWRVVAWWLRNRYRRAGLAELERFTVGKTTSIMTVGGNPLVKERHDETLLFGFAPAGG